MTAVRPERRVPLLRPDARRVLARPFLPGEWGTVAAPTRTNAVLSRVLALPDDRVTAVLAEVRRRFGDRHVDFDDVLRRHGTMVMRAQDGHPELSDARLRLVGAYFTQEYAVEAAALTNPSIVPAPHAATAPAGDLPFVMSLRAIGEGHLSSIVFRSGVLGADHSVEVDPPSGRVVGAARTEPVYDRAMFSRQLVANGAATQVVDTIMGTLSDRFTMDELESWLHAFTANQSLDPAMHEVVRLSHWLASANYIAQFPDDSAIGDRVLFPAGPTESRGMEDARFVRFVEDDGSARYYATYTAYDGFTVRSQLIDTVDFRSFRIMTLNGLPARTKGAALFPRRVDGAYAAVMRPDRETIAVATSSNLRDWQREPTVVWRPGSAPWDLIQLGNNGSPIETEAGWLVITHGVGPMRRYALGALLLDRDDPSHPLAYLPEALLEPSEEERDGYVPNVVYSCGALVHGGRLVLPYGVADVGTAVATFPLDELLDRLRTEGRAHVEDVAGR